MPYESDRYAAAHQWAAEQIARKYPGSTATLTALEGLIDQYLTAHD